MSQVVPTSVTVDRRLDSATARRDRHRDPGGAGPRASPWCSPSCGSIATCSWRWSGATSGSSSTRRASASAWAVARPLLFAAVFAFFRTLLRREHPRRDPVLRCTSTAACCSGPISRTRPPTSAGVDARGRRPADQGLLSAPADAAGAGGRGLITIVIGMVPLAVMMAWTGVHPAGHPAAAARADPLRCRWRSGLALLVSALSIENRDWERVLAFGLTIGALALAGDLRAGDDPAWLRGRLPPQPDVRHPAGLPRGPFRRLTLPTWEWVYSLVATSPSCCCSGSGRSAAPSCGLVDHRL